MTEADSEHSRDMRLAALRDLASFNAILRSPSFSPGEWGGGDEIEPGVHEMPYFNPSHEAHALMNLLYTHPEAFAVASDWPGWMDSEASRPYRDHPEAIHGASYEDLAFLFTMFVRQGRFSVGSFESACEGGGI